MMFHRQKDAEQRKVLRGGAPFHPSAGRSETPELSAVAERREEEHGPAEPTERALARLADAVGAMAPYLGERVVAAGQLINPLLDVWDAAHRIDGYVSAPVEHLLTVLVERTSINAAEVVATLDEVQAVALQASALVNALTSA